MGRIIGMDIHRTFAELAIWEDGGLRHGGRVGMTRAALVAFGGGLCTEDEVVVEATGNAMAVVRVLSPFVARVVVANPLQVKAIAHAHVKTDKIDAGVLARLRAAGFLPEVWVPDATTELRRRLAARRSQIVRQRTRLKNEVQSILHAHLIPPCPHADLAGRSGRRWLQDQPLPADEAQAVERALRELDRLADDIGCLDGEIAHDAIGNADTQRLMTIPGIDVCVAAGLIAAIGDVSRFAAAPQLVSYLGLNPRVRQSGLAPARHGRISKAGRSHARGLLVEAARAAAGSPGPLRAFYLRIRAKRGDKIATVATARKLAVLVWHLLAKQADYLWARPSLVAAKQRALELKAGLPKASGKRGAAAAYNNKALRTQEMRIAQQAEQAYAHFTSHWREQGARAPQAGRTV